MMIAVTITVREDPAGHDLIHCAEEAVRRDGDGHIGPEGARGLSFAQHTLYKIKILHHEVVRKLPEKLGAMAEFSLEHNGQVSVGAQTFKVEISHAAEFFRGICEFSKRGLCAPDETMERRVNGGHQKFVFVLEVKVDGAVGHAGAVGNLRHAGMEEAMLGDDFNGGIQDALVLV